MSDTSAFRSHIGQNHDCEDAMTRLPATGVAHLPAHQLPSALEMSPERWEDTYQFPKPSSNDWVIMSCRTNKRATWAAQLAADAGYSRCLIYKQVRMLLVKILSAAGLHERHGGSA